MPTERNNEDPPTGANVNQENINGGNTIRVNQNPPNNQSGTPRTRQVKNREKLDVKKFKGETNKMNRHVFQLHAERSNKSQFDASMEALRIYSSTVYKNDIESLSKLFTELKEPTVDEPPGPKETTKTDGAGKIMLDEGGAPIILFQSSRKQYTMRELTID